MILWPAVVLMLMFVGVALGVVVLVNLVRDLIRDRRRTP